MSFRILASICRKTSCGENVTKDLSNCVLGFGICAHFQVSGTFPAARFAHFAAGAFGNLEGRRFSALVAVRLSVSVVVMFSALVTV